MTNIDFSDAVIEEMRLKNSRRREMQWLVMDMTCMESFDADSFDVVIDKGSLDALMSVDDQESRVAAVKMFGEIMRVLDRGNPESCYVCVTLAENYIADTLVQCFAEDESADWHLDVETIGISSRSLSKRVSNGIEDNVPELTPFVPFFVCVRRSLSSSSSSQSSSHSKRECVALHFDAIGNYCASMVFLTRSDALAKVMT